MAAEKWRGTVSLPPLPIRKKKIGDNVVQQSAFLGIRCSAVILESEIKGYDSLKTNLLPPYDNLLVREKNARRLAAEIPSLNCALDGEPSEWPGDISLAWDQMSVLEKFCDTPEKVTASWVNQFSFQEDDEESGRHGLRRPQIGALHAIAAHFSVGKIFEAGTVVLPTGTGKTETMLAALVYQRLPRTLVLVPSTVLRTQIFKKFCSLGVLPTFGVVPGEIACPWVAFITRGIRTAEQAREILASANVIIALPDVIEASSVEAAAVLIDGCTDLFVDEAHHITATTWSVIRDKFINKRILQFTATPFRRDGKRIDGKIIFNYKLGDAQNDEYYRPITLETVEEYGDEEARDRAIALAAVRFLRRDREERGLDHLLMARTRSKARAESVFNLYQSIAADLRPVLIHSGSGRVGENRAALARVLDRGDEGSRIVICVDMLGEGFDLSNLKIAAIHDAHKSLAITLQFVGRFTRKGDWRRIGDATVVANIADPGMEAKLTSLYSEGADWDQLIRRLSEERIETELRLQDVIAGLKESGSLASQLSLWNLRPSLSTQFFRTTCNEWQPLNYKNVLQKDAVAWHSYSEREQTLVAVIHRDVEIRWGNYQNVTDKVYDLLILRWDKENSVLALYATDYDSLKSEAIATAVSENNSELVTGNPIFNILNNVELPLVKSLGSSRVGAISFTSYFGPNVTEGLANIEKAEAELNNIACLGYENGDRVLWGGTQRRGKIWQVKNGSIADWIEWTKATWAKVATDDADVINITRDFLRPQKLDAPHVGYPISLQWGEHAQTGASDSQIVLFDNTEVPLLMVSVDVAGAEEAAPISIQLSSNNLVSIYRLTISKDLAGGYSHEHVSGPSIRIKRGSREPVAFNEYLQKDPLIVRYADGTYSYNCYHIAASLGNGLFPRDRLEFWDWTGIPLNRESMHKERAEDTIQYRAFEMLRDEYDVIFNDDGSGEAADLICFKDSADGSIHMCLVHCKNAHGGEISRDIRNFYVLCGQAQKNITAKHKGLSRLYNDLKRRNETWVREGVTRFLKGEMRQLSYFKEKARKAPVKLEVILVQPGASIRTITDDSLRLLATTELFLIKTTEASMRVVLSQ